MRPLTLDDLARALDALGIADAHRDALLTHARPEVALALAPDDVPVGASKIGGAPDLPDDASWPVDRDARPLSFVAQLDLASLPAVDGDLPREGTLSFFYDTVRQPPGDAPGDEASLAMCWSAQKPLRRWDTHPDAEEFPACVVTATVAWGPPRDPVAWPAYAPDAVCVLASAALPFACDPDTNEIEPNDERSAAQPLLGGTPGCVTPVTDVLGCSPEGDAADWYQFTSADNCTAVGVDARLVFSTAFEALTLVLCARRPHQVGHIPRAAHPERRHGVLGRRHDVPRPRSRARGHARPASSA